ncbi:PulJ/GspJ family protein [Pseudohongiella sp.]|uniref:Type II secretion system protein GspI C-terminal domain-containing protein n=1 Tax=marine sediment metagenome TaxID=412755 RepID=A0A0F9W973_9ZZZZ|nr:type II secretion system protein [Pseudohongiella sp.]HDZ08713.1 type II secretion system protein [Pseudohongiella sp.]HEA62329.1 type II secretion system protein [Pseudohongiella sp.]
MKNRPGPCSCPRPRPRRHRGFTLLEVMVALTITSLVLGGLFSLAAGSKQLAVRTQSTLQDTMAARAQINFSLLENDYRDIEPIMTNDRYQTRADDILPDVLRRTAPMNNLLQSYQVIDSDTDEVIAGVRWIRLELPQ